MRPEDRLKSGRTSAARAAAATRHAAMRAVRRPPFGCGRGRHERRRDGPAPHGAGCRPRELQGEGEVPRGLESLPGVLFEAAQDEQPEVLGKAGREVGGVAGLLAQRGDENLRRGLAGERPLARHHLVENAAEREDVAPRVGGLPPDLLGRDVARRSHEASRSR